MKSEDTVASDHSIIDIRAYKPKRIPQLMWRECTPRALLSARIKKIWEVDPQTCPKFKAEMKIISFIYRRMLIRKILTHTDHPLIFTSTPLFIWLKAMVKVYDVEGKTRRYLDGGWIRYNTN